MSSTDSTELEDSYEEFINEHIEKQNFGVLFECVDTFKSEGKLVYFDWLKSIYTQSVACNLFDVAESLFKLYPELLRHDYFLDPLNCHELFFAAEAGNLRFLKFLLNTLCVSPRVRKHPGYNLFEMAAISMQLETAKFIWEELGISSTREDLVVRAIKAGHLSLIKFLYEELNIEVRHPNHALLSGVRSGQPEILQYLYDHISIRSIDDASVLEFAILHASQTGSLKVLECLLKFEFKFCVKQIQPCGDSQSSLRFSLYTSLCEAAKHGFLEVIQFVHEVVKIDLATTDPNHILAPYADLLKYAVEGGHEAMLAYLLSEAKLDLTLLPALQEDSLILTILNSDSNDSVKHHMLQLAFQYETPENWNKVLEQTTDEQRIVLGRLKRKSQLVNGTHKTPKVDVVS